MPCLRCKNEVRYYQQRTTCGRLCALGLSEKIYMLWLLDPRTSPGKERTFSDSSRVFVHPLSQTIYSEYGSEGHVMMRESCTMCSP